MELFFFSTHIRVTDQNQGFEENKKAKEKREEETEELTFEQIEGRCECGQRRVIRTSWTNLNPGRSFWACEDRLCNRSFEWAENPLSEKARRIVVGLLNSKSKLEMQLQSSKEREKRLWVVVILLVIINILT